MAPGWSATIAFCGMRHPREPRRTYQDAAELTRDRIPRRGLTPAKVLGSFIAPHAPAFRSCRRRAPPMTSSFDPSSLAPSTTGTSSAPYRLTIEGFDAEHFRVHGFTGREAMSEHYVFDVVV